LGLFRKNPKDPISSFIFENFGAYPKNLTLYSTALTHKSYSQNLPNNERLEYLGDSVISTIVSQYLYEKFPNEDEGFLTKLRSRIVSRENLNEIGNNMNVLRHVQYFKGNNHYKSLEGNVFEALIGALFIDLGFVKTKEIMYARVLINIDHLQSKDTDFKSRVLVWSQKNKKKLEYKLSEIEGAEKKYLAKLFIDGKLISESVGNSKKQAEKGAAKSAANRLL
jgi:ribonuclease III